jgi:hypothetical protein
MLRGLAFLGRYGHTSECWDECAPDVVYMFFHLATRPRPSDFTRRARILSRRAALRWAHEHPRLPARAPAEDVVFGYAYGAYTAHRVGLDVRQLRRDLVAVAPAIAARPLLGFDPQRERPSSASDWQYAMVGTHIAEGIGMRLRWSLRDLVRWRHAMQPYPRPRRGQGLGSRGWSAFYAVTHLVYVLNDYSLRLLPRARFEPEIDVLRAGAEAGIAEGDVEAVGEAVDALLSLGHTEQDDVVVRGRAAILERQNRDGSWGAREDTPYTRFHKTWVALDGLTSYGRRPMVRKGLP